MLTFATSSCAFCESGGDDGGEIVNAHTRRRRWMLTARARLKMFSYFWLSRIYSDAAATSLLSHTHTHTHTRMSSMRLMKTGVRRVDAAAALLDYRNAANLCGSGGKLKARLLASTPAIGTIRVFMLHVERHDAHFCVQQLRVLHHHLLADQKVL